MSRCLTCLDSKCKEVDLMEPLQCGPDKKRQRRATEMFSSMKWEMHLSDARCDEFITDIVKSFPKISLWTEHRFTIVVIIDVSKTEEGVSLGVPGETTQNMFHRYNNELRV
ncbi:hypothetical protein ACJMK2_023754 [Sinanodonta woodiana]|uniref:Uncharacterized protein n=1 Tax=Sinanodonta woodiana TaxID=1069815 RepID=A0ABD3T627_SINWO